MKITEIKKPDPSCDGLYVFQNIESLKSKKSKIDYITDTLKRCAVVSPVKKKVKRSMSGYNCFVRVSVKKGQPFKKVVKSGAWKQLEQKSKEHWKSLAKEGCPQRLWEE